MSMNLNTSERNVTARSVLIPGLVDLQKFMFSYRYHLTGSALAQVCLSMMGLMLWITSFNHCRNLLLLVLNDLLNVRAVYFKADYYFRCFPMFNMLSRFTTHLHLLHHQFFRCWGSILKWNGSIQGRLT